MSSNQLRCLTWAQIEQIATKVRIWMEAQTLLTMREAVAHGTLGGGCAIASYILWKLLLSAGEEAHLVCGSDFDGAGHCWVELGPYVIDITFTQFNASSKAVYICRSYPYHYEAERYLSDNDALAEISHWGCQSPTRYNNHIDKFLRETSKWIQRSLLQSPKDLPLELPCLSKHMTSCTKENSGDQILAMKSLVL